ncbi:PRC-barrel domain-containing protein [Candidatus Woesearchaeota archaeon]|nr:PRC-barrel domain-containing protein [Candidatus Woesearchaeota archaeon]
MKEAIITADDIVGKEAVDPHGAVLGVVVKLHIDTRSKQITGITVDLGFLKPDLFVGIDYIHHFGVDAVLLNKVPAERFRNMRVIAVDGTEIGHVKDVVLEDSVITQLTVIPLHKKAFSKVLYHIPVSEIKEIGASVILRKEMTP